MNPGAYNQYVTIERDKGTTRDAIGGLVADWKPLRGAWVRIVSASGKEALEAAQVRKTVLYNVFMRAPEARDVTAADRLNWRGEYLNIRTAPVLQRGSGEMMLTAESGAGT